MFWIIPFRHIFAAYSLRFMPTYGAWEKTVLKHCYPYIDYLSLHQYYQNNDGDVPSFLARSVEMEGFIREVAELCRAEKARRNSERDVFLSFDEWNVWYHFQKEGVMPEKWTFPCAIEEEIYDGADALLVGCMMNALLRNADVVKVACLAQLVNTIAPIMTEPNGKAWVQTINYPFLYASRYGRGSSLHFSIESPTYDCAVGDAIPFVDVSATLSADQTEVVLFLINRSLDQPQDCRITLTNAASASVAEWVSLKEFSPNRVNTADAMPVHPETLNEYALNEGILELILPKFSWNMVRIKNVETKSAD